MQWVSTFAGQQRHGYENGSAATARFNKIRGIAFGPDGKLYVADTSNNCIRIVSRDGIVSTVAGTGRKGYADGNGESAQFCYPFDIAIDAHGAIYVADNWNHRIRLVTPAGGVSTLAGTDARGLDDGPTSSATFDSPSALALDGVGNIYVTDSMRHRIRVIAPDGNVFTLADLTDPAWGRHAMFHTLSGLAVDASGIIYVSESADHRICRIGRDGAATILAGTGSEGYKDGPASGAMFSRPGGLECDANGNLYVADGGNRRIRKISPEREVMTVAGSGEAGIADGPAHEAMFRDGVTALTLNAQGDLFVADANRIRKILMSDNG